MTQKESQEVYEKTKKGLTAVTYRNQRNTSKRRGHPLPGYSLEELREWMYSQEVFHELFEAWVQSGYDKQMKPSCDRLDDSVPYAFYNMRIVTWRENYAKYSIEIKNGISTARCVSVDQYDLEGNFIRRYNSIAIASRETGIDKQKITRSADGRKARAATCSWKRV